MKKIKNPLRKRYLRELRGDFGKYAVIFLLLVFTIAFVSGFIVAGSSMIVAYQEGFAKYNTEDGNFVTEEELTDARRALIEGYGIHLTDNFYYDRDMMNGSTLRLFKNRESVNLPCVMDGRLPEARGEIAIDRMYASNNDLSVGDVMRIGEGSPDEGEEFTIVGLVALPDYSTMYRNNNDTMFDSIMFGVALVSADAFDALDTVGRQYSYVWKYDDPNAIDTSTYNDRLGDHTAEKKLADKLQERISHKIRLKSFTPRYFNNAIAFTGQDMGGDKTMMEFFLYIVIVIIAFVFGITISNTIQKEATVIGTLRASGYTKRELILHYMTLPLIVTLFAALVGNILGYTLLKDVVADLYYESYSLPTFVTIWSPEAFWKTTMLPLALMLLITWVTLRRRLSLSPLQFLRRDLKKGVRRRAIRLSARLPFLDRFRLRVFFQNIPSYLTLFVGLLFANVLLLFGLALPALLDHYQATIGDTQLAPYVYLLQLPDDAVSGDNPISSLVDMVFVQNKIETNDPNAEKFSAYSLKSMGEGARIEDVTLFGVSDKSRFIHADFDDNTVLISSAYADKYGLGPEDTITLKEPWEEKFYSFRITGIYPYDGGGCVFMSKKHLNETLGWNEEVFAGYFSTSQITDIDLDYVGQVIDIDTLTALSRQLNHSMGNMMGLYVVFAVMIFVILVYILSKLVIERNAQSISMAKIMGYTTGEIARLYVLPTTLVVVVSILITLPLVSVLIAQLYRVMLKLIMTGWMGLYIDPSVFVKMILLGLSSYAVVALLELSRIRRVPMDTALKNGE